MNNTIFENTIGTLLDLLKQQVAKFTFQNDSVSLQINSEFPNPTNIDPNELGLIINEIVQITVMLLKTSHLPTMDYQGDSDYLHRISIVKNAIVTDKLIRKYRFFTGPVINPLKSISMNPIIKPGVNSQFNLVSVNLILEYSDGGRDKKINTEMNIDHIEDLITGLEKMRDAVKKLEQKIENIQFVEEIN
ncbi:MAG: hypothetical protein CVU90_08845 [Firmicutes bacterium HGW-Firmicutes-15]|nr:MAG: hypothetical protein CVU90_08845 [Firmicutes bacterium HGW-Firmicutes-15]